MTATDHLARIKAMSVAPLYTQTLAKDGAALQWAVAEIARLRAALTHCRCVIADANAMGETRYREWSQGGYSPWPELAAAEQVVNSALDGKDGGK